MGIDSVELVMEVENAFDIRIPDEEAAQIFTVGNFHDVVWRHLEGRHSNLCNSQLLFYRLRREMSTQLNVPREEVLLNVPLTKLIDGKVSFNLLQQRTSLKFPSLLLPTPLSTIWGWTAAGLIIGSLIAEVVLINIWDFSSWILLWTVAAIIVVVQFDRLLEPFRTRIPDMTVREFINGVRTLNFKELSKATGVSRREMELVINEIIVNKLGVDPIEVAPEKSLTDDLGLD